MNLDRPAWRRRPARTALRVAASLIRRSIPGLRGPAVKYDEGRSRIVADLSTPLGLELYRYGDRVDPDLDLLRCLLRAGDVCVDGGANVGLFTLVAAAKVGPTGKVVAFEPSPKTHMALRANVELNGFSWVERREEALDDCTGERELIAFDAAGSALSSFRPRTSEGGSAERVRTVALDEAVHANDLARLRVIKLDLEGAELGALNGGRAILKSTKPDLIIEVEQEHLARQGASAGALVALLRAYGYRFYRATSSRSCGVVLTPVVDPDAPRGSPNLFATTNVEHARNSGVATVE
jgi:FkbM family methyltransferase